MKFTTIGAAAAIVLALIITSGSAQAPDGPSATLLSVTGIGESKAVPDIAAINVGVEIQATTAHEALAQNNERMDALIRTLRAAGIAERDIQTNGLWLQPRRDDHHVIGFTARNAVNARNIPVGDVGRIADAAIAVDGGNTLNGITFSSRNPDAQIDAARRDAAADAHHRAELYANAFRLHVVSIRSIAEPGSVTHPEEIVVTGTRLARPGFDSVPVAPGEMTTGATLSVTFELR